MNEVHKKLVEIQKKLVVAKGQWNDFSSFVYRNAEDILKAVKPMLGDFTLIIETNIHHAGDRFYVEAVAMLSDGVSVASAKGYAREALIQKGMSEPQITGSATSYAKKYALGNLFAIDNEADDDSRDNTDTLPILDPSNKAELARAIAVYKRDGNLSEVLKARLITPEVQAQIASTAQAELYAENGDGG